MHGGAADAPLGLAGAVRGKVKRTTIADPAAERARDLVRRNFAPLAPDRLWVADLTYVSTWSGWVYVAFVIDAYARRILGWRTATTMTTELVLDAVEQAIWTRDRAGCTTWPRSGRTTTTAASSTRRSGLHRTARRGRHRAVGRRRSATRFDNALAETINGLYKTELIKPRGPWRDRRRRRDRHRRMGRLVQPPPPLRVLRRHPTSRARGRSLRSTPEPSKPLSSQTS